jgi:uncharacterized protein
MIAATFRFYGPLNDFLPPLRRRARFRHMLPAPASVKDAIEALGVPHPEVDVILVGGIAVDFAYRLRDGDVVAAYPAFRAIDLAGVLRVGSDPPQPVRFVLDVHLGKLTSYLRLAGFDAIVREDDAEVAAVGAAEGRVVLTRDVALLKRGIVVHGYWVRRTHPELQLSEVLARFDLADCMQPFARCTRCNAPLERVEAAVVAARLPPRTRAGFREFRRCPGCDRLYWKGTHHARLAEVLDRARARVLCARDV